MKQRRRLATMVCICLFCWIYHWAKYKEDHRKLYFDMEIVNKQIDSMKRANPVKHEEIIPSRAMGTTKKETVIVISRDSEIDYEEIEKYRN